MQKCKVCGSNNFILINPLSVVLKFKTSNPEIHNYKNLRCNSCGVVTQSSIISKDKLVKYYDGDYRKENKVAFNGKNIYPPIKLSWNEYSYIRSNTFFKLISESNLNVNKIKSHLDVGGYQGYFAWAIKEALGIKSTVIDYNQEGLRHAKEFLKMDETVLINTDLVSELNKLKTYDLISMVHVFEHIDNPIDVLTQIKNNLSNEGLLYIEIPNLECYHLEDPTHSHMYDMISIENTLNIAGYKIIHKNFSSIPIKPFEGWITTRKRNLNILAQKASEIKEIIDYPIEKFKKNSKRHRRIIAKNNLQFLIINILNNTKQLIKNLIGLIIG